MDDFEKYYKASIRFLSFRPRSEKELKDYLAKKSSFAKASEGQEKVQLQAVINSIIASLKRDRFLNDEEFVKWWVEQRTILKPKASRVIKFELKQKGIAKDLIDNFFENDESSTSDSAKALALAEKKLRTIHDQSDKYKVKEKLGRFLASKGFDWDTIKEVIDRTLGK
jgi:regulatory protein